MSLPTDRKPGAMIVRAIATDELANNIRLLSRLETALLSVDDACLYAKTDEQAVLVNISGDLGDMIRVLKRELALP